MNKKQIWSLFKEEAETNVKNTFEEKIISRVIYKKDLKLEFIEVYTKNKDEFVSYSYTNYCYVNNTTTSRKDFNKHLRTVYN